MRKISGQVFPVIDSCTLQTQLKSLCSVRKERHDLFSCSAPRNTVNLIQSYCMALKNQLFISLRKNVRDNFQCRYVRGKRKKASKEKAKIQKFAKQETPTVWIQRAWLATQNAYRNNNIHLSGTRLRQQKMFIKCRMNTKTFKSAGRNPYCIIFKLCFMSCYPNILFSSRTCFSTRNNPFERNWNSSKLYF